MKQLTIPFGTLPPMPLGYIDQYPWDREGYCPKGEVFFSYDESALYVKLFAPIKEELTVLTREDNGPVWEDNCMEFFFAPFGREEDYLNIECNSVGAMVIGKGAGRHDRQSVVATMKPHMNVKAEVLPQKGWQVTYTLPFALVEEIYGKPFAPKKGDTFCFNAYICGEKTPIMHFGSWSPIDAPAPDFHRPECFGIGEMG